MTRRIFIRGMVQGVGMRPFLALLAKEYGVSGSVKNIGSNVELLATADEQTLDAFIEAIKARKPEMAEIAGIENEGAETGELDATSTSFVILPSSPGEVAMLPADFPVCSDCLKEIQDKQNRRFKHPFISCAVCGPRYSIMERAPYDRDTTSMAEFPMCPDCAKEYADPTNRRYHAQTVSCHNCGPSLLWQDGQGEQTGEEALRMAAACMNTGSIAAIKGVGGYHLACSPYDEQAVRRLRALKGREMKPFAVMFPDLAAIQACCEISPKERELLLSPARPIVLLKTIGTPFAPSVCGDAALTGCFLPYTAMQVLLLAQCGPLVMTSANQSGKPEIHEDGEMLAMLPHKDLGGVLYHRRRIVTRLDDSVARINAGQRQTIRRARGYAPRPLTSPLGPSQQVLAYGSDLKSAFCLLRGGEAYMSQYFGDMEELEVQRAYEANRKHMQGLFHITPTLAACDLHPGYHSSRLARRSGLPVVEVQHHHAHIASVMAEHGLVGPVIGVAFDGTGFGADGAIWGGEFLLCKGAEFRRVAHLQYVTLAGGDSVAVDARKAAYCYCATAGVSYEEFEGAKLLQAALGNNVNTMRYSGMGRLFDAMSSMLGLCHQNGYEGQCAIALENAANRAETQGIVALPMDFTLTEAEGTIRVDPLPVIGAVAQAGHTDQETTAAALGFHDAVCRMVLAVCERIRTRDGVSTVALSGGTFQNERILAGCMELLRNAGFRVYTNNEVPCNDGGLALGQAYVAAMGAQPDNGWVK